MDKAKIIRGLENWLEDHQGETLPLAFQSVQELYDVLTSEDDNAIRLLEEQCLD